MLIASRRLTVASDEDNMLLDRINRVDSFGGGGLLAPRDFTLPDNGSRLAVVFRLLHRFHVEFGGNIRRCDGVYRPAYGDSRP